MNKEFFGKKLKFNEILDGRIFIKTQGYDLISEKYPKLLKEVKIYTDYINNNNTDIPAFLYKSFSLLEEDIIKETLDFKIESYNKNSSYKKLVFKKQSGKGIIIGNCIRWEGFYNASDDYLEETEPAYFTKVKCFKLFKVATSMNKIVLVDKGVLECQK